MLKKVIYIFIVLIATVVIKLCIDGASSVGEIENLLITTEKFQNGTLSMIYSIDFRIKDNIEKDLEYIEVPTLNQNYSCKYTSTNITKYEKNDKSLRLYLSESLRNAEKFVISFQIVYNNIYTLKNDEAIYKMKFDGIQGFNTKNVTFRWNFDECNYSNETKSEDGYRCWKLGGIGFFSKQVFVKFNNSNNLFSEENSRKTTINDFLADGGYLIIIFLIVLIVTIIPNDGYTKNSGFNFRGKMRKFRNVQKEV